MPNLYQKILKSVYNNFKEDTSKMLIATSGIGWFLSSLAQCVAIYRNKEISPESKSFLFPQEVADGCINLFSFLVISLLFKKGMQKLCTTGKFAPKSVREFLEKNKDIYKDKVGKLDFNLDDVMKNNPDKFPADTYKSYKNLVTTLGTVGASILSCNVATPIIRNSTASKIQHVYKDIYSNPAYNTSNQKSMKI